MAWVINNFEPVYVDDEWDNPNYDSRTGDIDCMMCPFSLEECDKRFEEGKSCYWDEVWGLADERKAEE